MTYIRYILFYIRVIILCIHGSYYARGGPGRRHSKFMSNSPDWKICIKKWFNCIIKKKKSRHTLPLSPLVGHYCSRKDRNRKCSMFAMYKVFFKTNERFAGRTFNGVVFDGFFDQIVNVFVTICTAYVTYGLVLNLLLVFTNFDINLQLNIRLLNLEKKKKNRQNNLKTMFGYFTALSPPNFS